MNENQDNNNLNLPSRNEKKKEKKEKKKNKLLIIIIIFLLTMIFAGGYFMFTMLSDNGDKELEEDVATGGDVIKDYEFDENGNPVPVKAPNIGMAIKSAILGDKKGHAEMAIKNSGDIAIAPKVIYNGKTLYQAPELQPGEAVMAQLEFGALTVGEHEFNVLAMYKGGSGLSLKSKVVVFEEGTQVEIVDDGKEIK